ncbi:MAG TPA: trehalose-6-phosphate synthase [Thermoanaerobaculia bacterium]|nr:trehalose-6-phosphate synthase [Thermoanaerobaculia bacterium]
MSIRTAVSLHSRLRRALVGPARLRDSLVVIVGALLCAGLIFGLLYDVFDSTLRRWTDRDLNGRAHLIGVAMEASSRDATPHAMQQLLGDLASTDDAANLVACSPAGTTIAASGIARGLGCRSELALAALQAHGKSIRGLLGSHRVVVTAHPAGARGTLFIVQDRTFLDARRKHVLQVLFVSAEFALLALLVLARAGARIGSRRTEEAARSVIRQMRSRTTADVPIPPDLRLLVRDMHDAVQHLRTENGEGRDGAERLRAFVNAEIPNGGLIVIANREPYAHEFDEGGKVVVRQPASGLVTGIEPMLRACGGTWIAHGGGSADHLSADRMGRLAVPPGAPEYTLRRLWIEEEAYERYYSGFANEGIWPLCHVAHTQPSFRAPDWIAYQAVNETFARAAVEEASADGLLLIQDYHFALVPKLVRDQAPHVVTSLFWHIPWPNSEVAGICPWKESVLEGMLGADIIGFHTQQYCLNFLDTVQRYLECRVDLETMSVSYGGHLTQIRSYPISVEWPYPAASPADGAGLRESLGIAGDAHVSVGVDRADYTKGLIERVAAVEVLLEENPSLIGKYVFVQLASPTRTRIVKYRRLADDLKEIVARVNGRFGTGTWQPILLQMRTFSPDEVRCHYAMADSALVTPLHDGMNLVAKEYVAACNDGDGALVLSVFAGASKELDGALLVNPYDTQQVAETILRAIRMPSAERRARMQAMRDQIASHSIYDWSEKLLTDMRSIRQERARFWPQRVPLQRVKPREVVAG